MCTRYYYIFAFQLCVAVYSIQCVAEETHSNISIISPRQLAANKQQDEMNSPTTASSLLGLGQPALSYSLLFFSLSHFYSWPTITSTQDRETETQCPF
jgi:hypothetical protein